MEKQEVINAINILIEHETNNDRLAALHQCLGFVKQIGVPSTATKYKAIYESGTNGYVDSIKAYRVEFNCMLAEAKIQIDEMVQKGNWKQHG